MRDAIHARLERLGINPAALPPIAACRHCHSREAIEILYCITTGTFSITCGADGWTSADHLDLAAAIREWNAEQHRIRVIAFARQTGQSLH